MYLRKRKENKYSFLPVEKATRSTDTTMCVSPRSVTMTKSLYKSLGEPAFVAFVCDKKAKAIGLKVCAAGYHYAAKITKYPGGNIFVNASSNYRKMVFELTGADMELHSVLLKLSEKDADGNFVFLIGDAQINERRAYKKVKNGEH